MHTTLGDATDREALVICKGPKLGADRYPTIGRKKGECKFPTLDVASRVYQLALVGINFNLPRR